MLNWVRVCVCVWTAQVHQTRAMLSEPRARQSLRPSDDTCDAGHLINFCLPTIDAGSGANPGDSAALDGPTAPAPHV
jgi:hypothetical protein